MEKDGIISKSTSIYISPAFLILKKNGDLRMVVDYRKINEATVKINYPLPSIHYYLTQLEGGVIFSQIDLKNGYYQIKIKDGDRYKTAFNILGQIYQFNRMPFGLCNAPRTFQRAMNDILSDLDYVKVFLDDILIHSKSTQEHEAHLREVIERLHQNNIGINMEKFSFGKKQVQYLGHIILKDGIKANIEKMQQFTIPEIKSKKDIQKLTGLINWFRPFIKDLSTRLGPVYDKLSEENITWGEK